MSVYKQDFVQATSGNWKRSTDRYLLHTKSSTIEKVNVFSVLQSLVIHELLAAKLITLDEFPHKKFPFEQQRQQPSIPFSVFSTLLFFFPFQKAFSLNDVEIFCHAQAASEKATDPSKHET